MGEEEEEANEGREEGDNVLGAAGMEAREGAPGKTPGLPDSAEEKSPDSGESHKG